MPIQAVGTPGTHPTPLSVPAGAGVWGWSPPQPSFLAITNREGRRRADADAGGGRYATPAVTPSAARGWWSATAWTTGVPVWGLSLAASGPRGLLLIDTGDFKRVGRRRLNAARSGHAGPRGLALHATPSWGTTATATGAQQSVVAAGCRAPDRHGRPAPVVATQNGEGGAFARFLR